MLVSNLGSLLFAPIPAYEPVRSDILCNRNSTTEVMGLLYFFESTAKLNEQGYVHSCLSLYNALKGSRSLSIREIWKVSLYFSLDLSFVFVYLHIVSAEPIVI